METFAVPGPPPRAIHATYVPVNEWTNEAPTSVEVWRVPR